jgi:hypothetical protein
LPGGQNPFDPAEHVVRPRQDVTGTRRGKSGAAMAHLNNISQPAVS